MLNECGQGYYYYYYQKKKNAQNTAFKNVIICKFPYILLHENNVKC